MHSYLANTNQPYAMSSYPIFTAEIASTFNEVLLNRYLMDRAATDEEKIFLLGSYLDGLRTTFFRQTSFAEFELRIHEAVEKGESLTGSKLSEWYGEILRAYYGHDEGVCEIDPLYNVEWAYIPHFYYNFYVYQYATGIIASGALAKAVLDEEPGAQERYLNFLKSGGSDYPVNLLKNAGVDLTTPAPYEAAFALMNQMMDEIEALLDKKGV
jgi:oligoendopeptidase F